MGKPKYEETSLIVHLNSTQTGPESRPGLRDEKKTTIRLNRNTAAENEIHLIMAHIQYNLKIHFLPETEKIPPPLKVTAGPSSCAV